MRYNRLASDGSQQGRFLGLAAAGKVIGREAFSHMWEKVALALARVG